MRKVLVIGSPGSGKSRFARALAEVVGLPVVHMDNLFWRADGSTISRPELQEAVAAVMRESGWIIDGHYQSTLEERVREADTIFFLDLPVEVCERGILERQGKSRLDLPFVETELDLELMEIVRNFPVQARPQVYALIEKYQSKEWFVLRSRGEAERVLDTLAKT